jgi:hypothetical protein
MLWNENNFEEIIIVNNDVGSSSVIEILTSKNHVIIYIAGFNDEV